MKRALLAAAALTLLTAAPAYPDEQPVPIKMAPGHDAVENNCGGCHSLDYLRINSVFMDRKVWQAEVDKMVNVFGAPIEPKDAATIVDYLVTNYGTGG
jgi:nitrous oxide reductase accessory protein NosL